MPRPLTDSPAPAPLKNLLRLSKKDVERLLTEETPDIRSDIVKQVAENHARQAYSARELAIAEQIFRILVRDTEISVRETLAEALKENPNSPHDIIFALARDSDSVALPIIEHSSVLSDTDLIALIKSAQQLSKTVAIARRPQLSENITRALIDTRNLQAIYELVKNPGATIPDTIYPELLRDYEKNNDIMSAVASRPNLPITIVEKVITLVSESLAYILRAQYKLSSSAYADETEKTREINTLKLVDGNVNLHEIEKLVDHLRSFGRLTPSLILTSLCRGNLYFFETSLARLSSIPIRNAQVLIHDKGNLGFKALYGKAKLPEKFFAACKLLLEVVATTPRTSEKVSGAEYANDLAKKLLAKSSGQNIDNLSYLIALIRQNA